MRKEDPESPSFEDFVQCLYLNKLSAKKCKYTQLSEYFHQV